MPNLLLHMPELPNRFCSTKGVFNLARLKVDNAYPGDILAPRLNAIEIAQLAIQLLLKLVEEKTCLPLVEKSGTLHFVALRPLGKFS